MCCGFESVTAVAMLLAAGAPGWSVTVEERLIEEPPGEVIARVMDPPHIAHVVLREGKAIVAVDGHEDRPYDLVLPGYFGSQSEGNRRPYGHVDLLPDGRYRYAARKGEKYVVVVDGRESPEYDEIGPVHYRMSGSDWVVTDSAPYQTGERVAYRARKGDKWRVVVDGQESAEYDAIGEGPSFSGGEESHVLFTARRGRQWMAVVDGVEGAAYDSVFGPRGRGAGRVYHWACRFVGDDREYFLVVDGQEWPETAKMDVHIAEDGSAYMGDSAPRLWASDKGSRLAYASRAPGTARMIVDGEIIGDTYQTIREADFNTDGLHFAFCAQLGAHQGGGMVVILDGEQLGRQYDAVEQLRFGWHGGPLVFAAMIGEKWSMVIDGEPGVLYDKVHQPRFSPDGSRVAYAARSGETEFVVVDGAEGPPYDEIDFSHIQFWGPGQSIVYAARRGGHWYVVADGEEGPPYDSVRFPWLPHARNRWAYVGERDGGVEVVLDGRPGPRFAARPKHGDPGFSPDERHFAYAVTPEPGGKTLVLLDGRTQPPVGFIRSEFAFTQDGEHLVYSVTEHADETGRVAIVVDGERGPWFDQIPDFWALTFVRHGPPFEYFARRGEAYYICRHTP